MNWITFAIAAYLCLTLQVGLGDLWAIGPAAPSLVLVLGVFIGLTAPGTTVGWAMLVLGLLVDAITPWTGPGQQTVTILGPAAIGYLVGAYAVVQLRSMVFRESVLTLAVMTFVVGIFIQLVIVFLMVIRGPISGDALPGFSAADQLVMRFLSLLYTAVAAVPVGWLLMKLSPLFGFAHKPTRAY